MCIYIYIYVYVCVYIYIYIYIHDYLFFPLRRTTLLEANSGDFHPGQWQAKNETNK